MGYSNNGRNFWPDNTDTCLYLDGKRTFSEILYWIDRHFKIPFDPDLFFIYAEQFCTEGVNMTVSDFGYPTYTDFIVIEKTEG